MPISASTATCPTCAAKNSVFLTTYKRHWNICRSCGTGWPTQRNKYPLRFLKHDDLKKNAPSAEGMYNYFTTQVHIDHATQEAEDFHARYLEGLNIDFSGKSVLDVSGGNGFFVKWFQDKFGARASLTEYNDKTVDFAKQTHPFETCVNYDMNNHNLAERTGRKFDIVIAKACLMFCEDMAGFVAQLREVLNPGGILILGHSVEPTLGTMIRVQLDEFSYFALRQPDAVEKAFIEGGFTCRYRRDETDPDLYVYDHDLLRHWMMLHYYYEIQNARILAKERIYSLPARDRRRSTFVFHCA